jgi:D-alanine-D-alanine ligase
MIGNNINTAKYILISKKELLLKSIYEIIKNKLNVKKVVVKANCGGSTVDCFIVNDLNKKFQKEDFITNEENFLIEEFIEGREVTVAILENKALPYIMQTIPQKNNYFDYNSKYSNGGVLHVEEKNLTTEEKDKILKDCEKLHNAIGLNNLSRIDIIITNQNIPYFIEVNNVPGLTNVSGLPDIAKACKINYLQLLEIIIKHKINAGR